MFEPSFFLPLGLDLTQWSPFAWESNLKMRCFEWVFVIHCTQDFSMVTLHWQNCGLSNNYIMIMNFRLIIFYSVSGFNTRWLCVVNRLSLPRSYRSIPIYSQERLIDITLLPSSWLTLLRKKESQTDVRRSVSMSFRSADWWILIFLKPNWTCCPLTSVLYLS